LLLLETHVPNYVDTFCLYIKWNISTKRNLAQFSKVS